MIVSLTIVPMQTRSHPASLSRVTCALKSVSVGLDAATTPSFSFIASTWADDTGVTILAEVSVLVTIEPMTFAPFTSAKYFTQARI